MGTGTGAAAGSRGVGGGGIEALGSVRRRAATGGGGGGGDFREVIFVTNCFARSNQPAHGSGTRGLRCVKYQYPPPPTAATTKRIVSRLSHGPRRFRRRSFGAGFGSASWSSSRNLGLEVRRGGAGAAGASSGGGIDATDSGVTAHGSSFDLCAGAGGGGGGGGGGASAAGGSSGTNSGAAGRGGGGDARFGGGGSGFGGGAGSSSALVLMTGMSSALERMMRNPNNPRSFFAGLGTASVLASTSSSSGSSAFGGGGGGSGGLGFGPISVGPYGL